LRRVFFIRPAIDLLNKLNRIWKFDVVHFNEPHIVLRKPDLPSVCTMHSIQANEIRVKITSLDTLRTATDIGDLVLKSPTGSICDLLTTRATDRIICPSPHLASLIRSCCFVDESKICVIPNGIDLDCFNRAKDCGIDVLNRYGLEKGNYVLFVGRLSHLKGVQYLIDAFRNFRKELCGLKLAVVGTGDFEGYLRNMAHGMDDVVFTGHVHSLDVKKTLYENSLVVVVPSSYEGLPMVALEAMACGKAVVASAVGGLPFLIRHGKNGFLSEPENPGDLERFIRILLLDADLREKMGSVGRKMVMEEFTVEKMVDKTYGLYKSLMPE